jgi:hypothetical protein
MRDVLRAVPIRLRDESGIALVMAILVVMVLSIATTSLIIYSTSNERAANRSKASHDAYTVATAGIENAIAQIAQAPKTDRDDPALFTGICASPANCQQTFDTGETVQWTGQLFDDRPASVTNPNIHLWRWHLSATATVPNPAAAGNLTRNVTADLRLKPVTIQDLDADAWKYIYSKEANDPDGCDMELPNNPNVQASFYVTGTLCLDNNSSIVGPTVGNPDVSVHVRENIILRKNGNDVGTLARPLTQLIVEGQAVPGYPNGGCSWKGNPYNKPCTAVDHAQPNSISGQPAVAPVFAEFDDWFAIATPTADPLVNPCDPTVSFNHGFLDDDDLAKNRSIGTVNLAPGFSYRCKTLLGDLAWNAGTQTLTISGTMFLDGNVDYSSAGTIEYDGWGALYLSGYFHVRQTVLCAVKIGSNCDETGWSLNPADVLLIAAEDNYNFGPSCPGCSALLEQSAVMQGAMYGEYDLGFQNNSYMQGPMVSNQEIIQNSFTFNYIPPLIKVPFGTPGNTITEYELDTPTNYTG